jgi:hypothetical protein
MKTACCLVLCAALAETGCVTLPPLWPDHKPAPAAAATPAPVPPPTVTPEQVNDANAKAMAAALQQELDYAAQPPAPARAPEKNP